MTDLMHELINELSALHERLDDGREAWCEECVQIGDDSGEMEHGRWPCETMQIVERYKQWGVD